MGDGVARVGVVVLNWNGREYLGPCLDSLLLSDHPDFVVVVVDNGSEDGSVDELRARADVEVVALGENRRFAGGNNAGAIRAIELGAEVILILNNDTTIEPDALGVLARAVDAGRTGCAADRLRRRAGQDLVWGGSLQPPHRVRGPSRDPPSG